MAILSGAQLAFQGDTTQADSSLQTRLGSRAKDVNGGEHIYLRGTASVVAGSWVTFDSNYTTTLLADLGAPVAVAGTAITTDQYGWFQIAGINSIARAGKAIGANAQLFYDNANAGYVDDTDVATGFIVGAVSVAASSGSAVTVYLSYPYMPNAALD